VGLPISEAAAVVRQHYRKNVQTGQTIFIVSAAAAAGVIYFAFVR
jgi:hypothetical protein